MKALVFDKPGPAREVLALGEKSKPVAGAGEVLVRMLASPLNPSDLFFTEGTYRIKPQFPRETAGFEGAGVVESAGKGVPISTGTLVAFFYRRAWAEYVVVPAAELAVLPAGFPTGKAAQFAVNPFTAWGLLEVAVPAAGEWMLLTGANSAVARILIQLAKARGVRTIAVVRDMAQAPGLRALGADLVLDMADPDFPVQVKEATNGRGFDVALDAVGGHLGTRLIEHIAPFGRLVLYGAMSKDPVQFFNGQIVYKNLRVTGFGIRAFLAGQRPEQRAYMIESLVGAIGSPAFQLPVIQEFGLEAFREALEANSRGGRAGKCLFRF